MRALNGSWDQTQLCSCFAMTAYKESKFNIYSNTNNNNNNELDNLGGFPQVHRPMPNFWGSPQGAVSSDIPINIIEINN